MASWTDARLRRWLEELKLGTGLHVKDRQTRLRLHALAGLASLSTEGMEADWHERVLWPLADLVERMMQRDEVAPQLRLEAFTGVVGFATSNEATWHRLELAACLGLWEALGRAARLSGSARERIRPVLLDACLRAARSGEEEALDHAIGALATLDDPSTDELLRSIAERPLSDWQRPSVEMIFQRWAG